LVHEELSNLDEAQKDLIKKCHQCFLLDGNDFIEELVENWRFWQAENYRAFLYDLAVNFAEDKWSIGDLYNSWVGMELNLKQTNPDWFGVCEKTSLDQILERVEGHLETIDKKLDEDNIQKLIDDHEQRMKTNIDMIESRVKKLENGLQEKLKGVVAALVIVAGIIIFAMLRA
jgi:hypothetical protein